ncbi:uncharacterized protein CDAR_11491 [Caerostris darwini]|uniref:unspecific monooxygenase n=1 Tax=Caerostris darwini TaxID=1538125 RepID=A0AAV4RD57_9ARAC|nr:uncharacterized protein CDAR_11491 [Caerostris darwini]
MKAFNTIATLASGIFLVLYWMVQQNGGKTPPGPVGLPLLGYLPFLEPNPHLVLQRLAKDYGPIFSIRLGSQYLIILDDISFLQKAIVLINKRPKHISRKFYNLNQELQQTLFFLMMATCTDVQEKAHKEARLNRLHTRLSDTNLLRGAFSSKERRYSLRSTEAAIAQLLRRSNSIPLMILGV